jgi:acyl-CoA reductase-like NAD-dependent aldehyde dehydrogenase
MESLPFLVNGRWVTSGKKRAVVNPYKGGAVHEVCQASGSDIEAAIDAACEAFARTKRLAAFERSEILLAIARGIESDGEQFARLITGETGKPITFSRAEVERSVFTFRTAAEEAKRIIGEMLPLDLATHSRNRFGMVQRFPLGPITAITPFNFPLNLVAHKIAPAIAAGNTILLKPSSNAPGTSLHLGKIVDGSGFPKGGLNILPCSSGEAGQLIDDERIKMVSFTGSPSVGWELKQRAGKKRITLELGGNAGVIVDKGSDIDRTVKRIALGAYGSAGQSCISVQRIYVHKSIFEDFKHLFVGYSMSLIPGDPEDEKTIIGPMIDEDSAIKVENWIAEAVKEGAQVLCGGKRKGALMEATVLTNTSRGMKVSCQEVFAPVVTLEPFNEFDEAIRAVNDSSFGLQAGVFTNNFSHAFKAFRELEVGGVIINDYPTYRIDHMPYGGVKDSGFGREGIRYAIEEMTEPKLMAINLG